MRPEVPLTQLEILGKFQGLEIVAACNPGLRVSGRQFPKDLPQILVGTLKIFPVLGPILILGQGIGNFPDALQMDDFVINEQAKNLFPQRIFRCGQGLFIKSPALFFHLLGRTKHLGEAVSGFSHGILI